MQYQSFLWEKKPDHPREVRSPVRRTETITNRNTRLPDHSLRVLQQDHWRKKTMNIPLSKVEEEMLKMLRLKDKRYRRGLLQKIQEELKEDYDRLKK